MMSRKLVPDNLKFKSTGIEVSMLRVLCVLCVSENSMDRTAGKKREYIGIKYIKEMNYHAATFIKRKDDMIMLRTPRTAS